MYVVIENHFVKDSNLDIFIKVAEEILVYSTTMKGCFSCNIFEKKSIKNEVLIIMYWRRGQEYVEYSRTQKAISLKKKLDLYTEHPPHVDIYYSILSGRSSTLHHVSNVVKERSSHLSGEKLANKEKTSQQNVLEKFQDMLQLSQRYINITTSSAILMKIRQEEIDRKKRQASINKVKTYSQFLEERESSLESARDLEQR